MNMYLIRAHKEGTPLVDGETVSFVWQGKQAPVLIGDFSDWENNPRSLTQVSEDTWLFITNFPRDLYLEYAFLNPESGQRLPDPFNPRSVSNGIGKLNHYFYMDEAFPNPLIKRISRIPHGKISRHDVPTNHLVVGSHRTVYLTPF